jgi:hypothetical protein
VICRDDAVVGRARHDRWLSSAPIARRYPEAFRPVAGTGRRGRYSEIGGTAGHDIVRGSTYVNVDTTTPLPAEVKGRETWRIAASGAKCRTLYRSSPFRVRLAHDVREEIEYLFETAGAEREAACQLFGYPSNQLIEITRTDHFSVGNDRTVIMDYGLIDRDNDPTVHGDVYVGSCHSHTLGLLLPSGLDVESWALVRRALRMEAFVGLISTRTQARWEFAGWVARFGTDEYDVAERSMPL